MRSAVTLSLYLLLAGPALAQPAAQLKRAEELNEEGKVLYSEQKDFEGAAGKFRQAIAIAPDPRYYFNLCSALDRLELHEQALEACDQVFAHKPKPDLAQKTGKKAADIRQRMKADTEPAPPADVGETKPPPPSPTPPGDAAMPAPATQTGAPPVPAGYRGVHERTELSAEREGRYGWALGVGIGPVRNNYTESNYDRSGFDLKVSVDLLVWRKERMGIQPYLNFSIFGDQRQTVLDKKPLSIFDLGAAWYWHVRLWRSNFYFTPVAGLSAAFLNPAALDVSYLTLGIRLETALSWVIGERHVLSLAPVLSIYPPAGQIAGTLTSASNFGLDKTGSTFAIVLGYTYRFDYGWLVGLPLE